MVHPLEAMRSRKHILFTFAGWGNYKSLTEKTKKTHAYSQQTQVVAFLSFLWKHGHGKQPSFQVSLKNGNLFYHLSQAVSALQFQILNSLQVSF